MKTTYNTLKPFILLSILTFIFSACIEEDGDTTPPEVISSSPSNNETNVSPTTKISVTFSEEIDEASLTASSFNLKDSNSSNVSGSTSVTGNTVIFTPSAELSYETEFTIVATSSVEDLSGNGLLSVFTSTFTTEEAPDTTPPKIVDVAPNNGENNVEPSASIVAEFSEDIDQSTVKSNSFVVTSNSTSISGSLTISNRMITFDPSSNFPGSETIEVTVSGIEDLNGNIMNSTTWSFVTRSTTTLSVSNWTPGTNSTLVGIDDSIIITFSDNIDGTSVGSSIIYLKEGNTTVPATLSTNGNKVTLDPSQPLTEFNTNYTLTVKASIKDVNGNTMSSDYSGSFETIQFDEEYVYIVRPYFGRNDDKVLDNRYETDNYYPAFIGTWGGYSGQLWNIRHYGDIYYTMSTATGGDDILLDSNDGSDIAYLSQGSTSGEPYTGQWWFFDFEENLEGKDYYTMRTYWQGDNHYLDQTCTMRGNSPDIPVSGDYLWSFERWGKK